MKKRYMLGSTFDRFRVLALALCLRGARSRNRELTNSGTVKCGQWWVAHSRISFFSAGQLIGSRAIDSLFKARRIDIGSWERDQHRLSEMSDTVYKWEVNGESKFQKSTIVWTKPSFNILPWSHDNHSRGFFRG